MPAYRFCRPDDQDLLIKAINTCVLAHTPGALPFTLKDYQRYRRELDLWPSSCMVALGNDPGDVLAACIGCKRKHGSLVFMIGSRPDQLRRGHALHLLTSLSNKLAVLGPPKIVVEIPADNTAARTLFKKAGYTKNARYVDLRCNTPQKIPPPSGTVDALTVADLLEQGLLDTDDPFSRAWLRQPETLINCQKDLQGLGIISAEKIEAYLLYRENKHEECFEILALGVSATEHTEKFIHTLLKHVLHISPVPVTLPKAHYQNAVQQVLKSLRFKVGREYSQLQRLIGKI